MINLLVRTFPLIKRNVLKKKSTYIFIPRTREPDALLFRRIRKNEGLNEVLFERYS
jgi:hypothetical protein